MDGIIRIGIDPGETTGVAVFRDENLIYSDNIGRGVYGVIDWWDMNEHSGYAPSEVIVENFVAEPSFVGVPIASEVIGALRAMWKDGELIMQDRSAKATLFNQQKSGDAGEAERFAWLEERGFKRIGKGHNLDAITHVLVNRKRARDPKFWKKYWAD